MTYDCEFILKVKIKDMVVSSSASEEEIKNRVSLKGHKMLNDYFNNLLLDPNKEIFLEEVIWEPKQLQ